MKEKYKNEGVIGSHSPVRRATLMTIYSNKAGEDSHIKTRINQKDIDEIQEKNDKLRARLTVLQQKYQMRQSMTSISIPLIEDNAPATTN